MTNTILRGASVKVFTIPAMDRIELNGPGEFIACLEATDKIHVSLNNGGEFIFGSGQYYRCPDLMQYQLIGIENRTAAPIVITFAWGSGEYQDRRLTATGNLQVVNPAGQNLDVELVQPSIMGDAIDLAIAAAAAHVQVLPALGTRKSCLIKNIGVNPARIGNGPTNTRGHHLAANETFAADGTFEVRAFSQLGTTLSVIWTGA